MGSDNFPKRAAGVFFVVVILYFAAFYAIEHLRVRKAPWEVLFTTNTTGQATLIISQTNLNIRSFAVTIAEESGPEPGKFKRVKFDHPQAWPFDLPFGQCIFQDLTFLPGTVTMNVYDHEVELLPRTLVLNKREYAWQPEGSVTLYATNRLPARLRSSGKK